MLNHSKKFLRTNFLIFLVPLLCAVDCKKKEDVAYYETVSMNLLNASNSGLAPVTAGSSVYKHAYAIQLNLLMKAQMDSASNSEFRGNFINEDQVTDLLITSSSDFNGIPANQSLNNLFLFREGESKYSELDPTTGIYNRIFSRERSDREIEWNAESYLLLMHPPQIDGTYTFYVSGTFSDGRILSDSTTVNLYE